MSNQPISEHIDCGKLEETSFLYNCDRDEYCPQTFYEENKSSDVLKDKTEQTKMIKNYKVNMKSVDQQRRLKAISVNEIMNKAQLSINNPDNRYCGEMDANATTINEYEWR